jgi:Type II secretory pathway, component ExeA (predicted ATPase)
MTSLHADEAFLEHYQLSHDPFAPRVPGFKFFPPSASRYWASCITWPVTAS